MIELCSQRLERRHDVGVIHHPPRMRIHAPRDGQSHGVGMPVHPSAHVRRRDVWQLMRGFEPKLGE